MTFARAVARFGVVAALLAVVALAPLPAAAGPVVYQSNMACLDVFVDTPMVTTLNGIEISQNDATPTAKLEKTGSGDANLSLTFKANGGLPPNADVVCGLLCVVDGDIFTDFFEGLFDSRKFKPCGTTTAGGKLTTTAILIDFNGDPFHGGCLVPIPAFWIKDDPLVVCAPGFGTFAAPPPCTANSVVQGLNCAD